MGVFCHGAENIVAIDVVMTDIAFSGIPSEVDVVSVADGNQICGCKGVGIAATMIISHEEQTSAKVGGGAFENNHGVAIAVLDFKSHLFNGLRRHVPTDVNMTKGYSEIGAGRSGGEGQLVDFRSRSVDKRK